MIIDRITEFSKYIGINELFKTVSDNLTKFTDLSLEKGKYELCGDELYVVVNDYTTSQPKEDSFENHHKYIDIQCVVKGTERIDAKSSHGLESAREYDETADYEMFKTPDRYVSSELCDGDFAIFFPGEAHRPNSASRFGESDVHKVIFKVLDK